MQHFSIPACYFPSTTLFLEDTHNLLLSFVLQSDEGLAYRVFDEPLAAWSYIQNQCYEWHEGIVESTPLHPDNLPTDFIAIRAEIYNARRFSEISVVVVDQSLGGLDFCYAIQYSKIKRILLIEPSDESLAKEAIHEGLIHRYVKKNDVSAVQKIIRSIHELQAHYFQEMSHSMMRMFSIAPPRCLSDKVFADSFRRLREENGIMEYYLIDHFGSFLLLDGDANVSFFIVRTAEEVRSCYEQARDHGASEILLNQLAKGDKIPNFWPGDFLVSMWDNESDYFSFSRRLDSEGAYFYAHVRGKERFDIRQKKILSYHRYLEALDVEELLMG